MSFNIGDTVWIHINIIGKNIDDGIFYCGPAKISAGRNELLWYGHTFDYAVKVPIESKYGVSYLLGNYTPYDYLIYEREVKYAL
jgi:hypothetical protein